MTRNCTWWMPQMSVVLHKQHIVSLTLLKVSIFHLQQSCNIFLSVSDSLNQQQLQTLMPAEPI